MDLQSMGGKAVAVDPLAAEVRHSVLVMR